MGLGSRHAPWPTGPPSRWAWPSGFCSAVRGPDVPVVGAEGGPRKHARAPAAALTPGSGGVGAMDGGGPPSPPAWHSWWRGGGHPRPWWSRSCRGRRGSRPGAAAPEGRAWETLTPAAQPPGRYVPPTPRRPHPRFHRGKGGCCPSPPGPRLRLAPDPRPWALGQPSSQREGRQFSLRQGFPELFSLLDAHGGKARAPARR